MITSGGRPYRIVVAGGLLVLAGCGVFFWMLLAEQERAHNAEIRRYLLDQGRMLAQVIRSSDTTEPPDSMAQGMLRRLRERGVLATILQGEKAVGPGDRPQPGARELLRAPEVRQARTGRFGFATRSIQPDGPLYIAVGVRVGNDPETAPIVWLARPHCTTSGHPAAVGRLLGLTGGIAALTTGVLVLVSLGLRRHVLAQVRAVAGELSDADPAMALRTRNEREPREIAALREAAEALRRRMASELSRVDQQRRVLQGLIDQSQEGIIVADHRGQIILINAAALRLLQIHLPPARTDSLIGRSVKTCIPQRELHDLLVVPSPANDDHDVAGPRGATKQEIRLQVETKKGPIHVLARASDVVLNGSEVEAGRTGQGRVVMLTDITELQHTIQVRTDFVANASHELRTPLSTISAAVETLLSMDLREEGEHAQVFLEKIDRQSARLQQMVSDLLDLSRLESPTEKFEPRSMDPRAFLNDMHVRYEEVLEQKRLHWSATVEGRHAETIHANPRLLRLVLDNLVDNAIKFTAPEGHIAVRIHRTEEQVVFEVADDGCGIPEEEQQRVFERFYQVQRSRSGPDRGTGLGLSIIRHAVGAMNGTATLSSQLGKGTTVRVVVPQPPNQTVG